MKIVRFLITFLITISLTVGLNYKIGDIPPMGKFLDPFNGFWKNAEIGQPEDQNFNLSALQDPVEVVYDEHMIPRIFARNEQDLYFMQGYITAYHRLWQMEIQALSAAGRISEIVGSRALAFDRLQRRKGLPYGAKNALKAIRRDNHLYPLLLRYTEGVNTLIEELDYADYPIEYKILNYKPELWTPLKTMYLLMYMSDMLSTHEEDLENTNTLQVLGKDTFDLMFPDREPGNVPIIPPGTEWEFEPLEIARKDLDYYQELVNTTIPKPNPNNGSNNWVLGSSKTARGNPLLANDMHLSLNLPSIWFLMQLSAPGINVFGGTIPGALGVIVGFNDSISWGVTNAQRDVVDWYNIEYRDHEKKEYKYDNKWLKTQKVIEEFNIRGEGPFYDTIFFTHYGPVVYDQNFPTSKQVMNYAMKWTGHDESQEQKAFYLLNKAGNYDTFVDAIRLFDCPAQNFVFASVQKDIAALVNGKFPLKWKEQGKFLMNGANSAHEWQDIIPREHNPHSLNPERDYLFSANQYPVDSTYPYYIYDTQYEMFRNRRIQNQLEEIQQARPEEMMVLQNDNYNLKAEMSLPFFLNHLDTLNLSAQAREVYAGLKKWNYYNDIEQSAPSVYEVWWRMFYRELWQDFRLDSLPLNKPGPYHTIQMLQDQPELLFTLNPVNDPEQQLTQLIQTTYQQAIDSVSQWSEVKQQDYNWGRFKSTGIMHILGLEAFSHPDVAVGGYDHIINANDERHGASFRIIMEMSHPVKAWTIFPGGQSGNPGSKFYDNYIDRWRNGKYLEVSIMDPNTKADNILFTHNFQP